MDDPLRTFLRRKRAGRRHALSVPVTVRGNGIFANGESLDASVDGMCLRIRLSEVLHGHDAVLETPPFATVLKAMADGLTLEFSGIIVGASPARIALDPDREGSLLLGCRLERSLTSSELDRLGIDPVSCGPQDPLYGLPSQALPHRINEPSSCPTTLHSISVREGILFYGHLVAYGRQALAVAIPGESDPHPVLRRFDCLEMYFHTTFREQSLWTSRALIAALPTLSGPSTVELGLVARKAPDRPLEAVLTPP